LNDGRVLEPEGGSAPIVEPKKFKSTKRRSLNELPAPAGTMNGVACVLVYTLMGISEYDIADAMKVGIDDVKKLKKHSAYSEAFGIVSGEFINANSELLASRLAAHSHIALDGVVDIAKNGKKESNKLKANMDLLTRGGVTAKDHASQASMHKSELRIMYVDDGVEVSVSHTIGGMNGQ
jgi:hypothetical protein